MKQSFKKQQGYLMLVAVLLIFVMGFLGIAVSYMVVSSSTSTTNNLQTAKAFYLAESGLEHATHQLLTSNLTNRLTCAGLSISNTLGAGAYNATGSGPFYVSSPTTLNGALTAASTTIPVVSTSGYQSSGRIMIDQELINYSSVDGTNFVGVTRGVDGSIAASHSTGTRVGQFQCNVTAQGGVPSLSPPSTTFGGKRTLTQSVQLEEGWAAGNNISSTLLDVIHWNTPTEEQWTLPTVSMSSAQDLNGVSIISNVDAWVVGDKAAALRYNGSSWTLTNTGIAGGDNLTSVSAVSSQEAWACADQGKVYKWTPASNWTNPLSPGNNPTSISMIDTDGNGLADAGWVVGKKQANRYNGSTWTLANSGITIDLTDVSTVAANDAWAVGKAIVYQWNGTSWSGTAPTAATLNSVSMIRSGGLDIGWTVGTGSAALYYNGSSWTLSNSGILAGLTLTGVVTVSATEAWTVSSTGRVYEWDGSTWNLITTATTGLNAIDVLLPSSQPISAWAESFA